ncbi:MAG: plant-type carbonic anhydrase [Pseudonocardia sp.]|nr:plant-type carbonic anhydrase [Pseudonocardia sp.]
MIDELLRRHDKTAAAAGSMPGQPSLRTAIVTCMDARIDAYALLGLSPGDVHVLRNAGGVITDDVIRSLAISQRKLGTVDVMIVHHTRCGMATFTDEEFADELAADVGQRPSWRAHTFSDPAEDVRDGIAALRSSPFLGSEGVIRGFVLDVVTGELTEVT